MCVRSTYFSVLINGEMVDYFEGKRGFHQGDPMSPFLFTIVMEYLSRLLTRLDKSVGFYHHPKCHRIDLKHILFADDLFLFSNGRCSSILAIKDIVERFLSTSDLAINLSKSQVFPAGMSASKIILVEGVLGTAIAKLPVRYLGIPLSSKKLNSRGHICFLVSWKEVCKIKKEGGLGLRDLSTLNDAMRLNQLWKFSNEDGDVWNSWLRAYWTRGNDWWDVDSINKTSWVIRDIEASKRLSSRCVTIQHSRLCLKGSGNGFSVNDTYDTLIEHSDKVYWPKLVWNRFNSPRSLFHLWLLARNKLLTKDRLQNMRLLVDTNFVLCTGMIESRDHLFFECHFAKGILLAVLVFLQVRKAPKSWHLLIPNPTVLYSK
ncbi:hypothetical protein QQ045_027844 [Rhodiola kirilowii]